MSDPLHLIGGALAGSILSAGFLGVVTVQSVRYFEIFGSRDRTFNKIAVVFLWCLQFTAVGSLWSGTYWTLVQVLRDPVVGHSLLWGFMLPQITAVVSQGVVLLSFVQTTFALSKNIFLSGFLAVIILAQGGLAVSCLAGIYIENVGHLTLDLQYTHSMFVSAGLSMFGNLSVCGSLCWFLMRHRTGNLLGDSVIVRMVSWVVPLCAFVFLWQVANSVSVIKRSPFGYVLTGDPIGIIFNFIYLATLHARSALSATKDGKHNGRRINNKADAFMGFAISVATHVHRAGDAAPGDRELQLLNRLERRYPIELDQALYPSESRTSHASRGQSIQRTSSKASTVALSMRSMSGPTDGETPPDEIEEVELGTLKNTEKNGKPLARLPAVKFQN